MRGKVEEGGGGERRTRKGKGKGEESEGGGEEGGGVLAALGEEKTYKLHILTLIVKKKSLGVFV